MSEAAPEPHAHSHGLSSKLTAKVGPFPAVVWAVIIVAAYLLYRMYRSHQSAAANTVSYAVPVDTSTGTVPVSGGSSGSVSSGTAPITPESNAQWATTAANGLFGSFDPSSVEQALADFLAGNSLTSAEQAIVNKALSRFGSPPEGVIGGFGSTSTAPTQNGKVFVVSDQADANILQSMGIAPSQLRYSGSDPKASAGNAVQSGYNAPVGLSDVTPGESAGAVWVGLAGSQAPAGATILQGATRTDTATLVQEFLNNLGL